MADVRPYLGDCGVMAVPLRIGGGSRLKILEALASGLPVVSTRIGAEGLHLKNGRHLTVVERTEDMAQAWWIASAGRRNRCGWRKQGRRLVRERYDWDVLADKLEAVWEKVSTGFLHPRYPARGRLAATRRGARKRGKRAYRSLDGVAVRRRAGAASARPGGGAAPSM